LDASLRKAKRDLVQKGLTNLYTKTTSRLTVMEMAKSLCLNILEYLKIMEFWFPGQKLIGKLSVIWTEI
jgi:hypothetical protein